MNNQAQLFPAWKQAYETFLGLNPEFGFVLNKKWLMEKFDIPEPVSVEDVQESELAFLSNFERFRSELLENNFMDIVSIGKGNYQVIHPKDQAKVALLDWGKAMSKEGKRLKRRSSFVNTSVLSESERQEHTQVVAKVATIQSMFNRRKLLGR